MGKGHRAGPGPGEHVTPRQEVLNFELSVTDSLRRVLVLWGNRFVWLQLQVASQAFADQKRLLARMRVAVVEEGLGMI